MLAEVTPLFTWSNSRDIRLFVKDIIEFNLFEHLVEVTLEVL